MTPRRRPAVRRRRRVGRYVLSAFFGLGAIGLALFVIDKIKGEPLAVPSRVRNLVRSEPWALVDLEPSSVVLPTFEANWVADAWRASPPEQRSQTTRRVAAQTSALHARIAMLHEAGQAQWIASFALFMTILLISLIWYRLHQLSGRFSAQTFLSKLRLLDQSNRRWLAESYRDRLEVAATVVDAWMNSVVASSGRLSDSARRLDGYLATLSITHGPARSTNALRANRFLDRSGARPHAPQSQQRRAVRDRLDTIRRLTDQMLATRQFEVDADREGAAVVAAALQESLEQAYVVGKRKSNRPEWVRAALELAQDLTPPAPPPGGAS